MACIVSDEYRVELARLEKDPIIIDMACGLPPRWMGDCFHDNDTPRFDFMMRANDEYRRRGGTGAHTIGAVARALRAADLSACHMAALVDEAKRTGREPARAAADIIRLEARRP